jgi:tetratricopeptide (TPR) repeat protein
MVRRLHDGVQLVDTLLIRAIVRDRLNDSARARADIEEAKALIPGLTDPTYRDYLRVATLRATAMLTATSPEEAEALLTEAIDFQATRNDSLNLPDLLLQRARARRTAGLAAGAMADLQRGIAELERRRRSLPENELRWGAFHAAEELFDEAIDAAISANDAGAAFRFAERARARSLIESYVRPPVLDVSRLPAHTIIIEYAALPSRLVVFIAEKSGVRALTVACERAKLVEEIDAFSRQLRKSPPADVKSTTAAVYQRLIEPIEAQLLGSATIVFVPDGVTSTVPFSALMNSRGEYLLEQHAIAISPSAAFLRPPRNDSGKGTCLSRCL